MATFVESLGTYLQADSGITALVGGRVYPVRAPDSPTFPYITYRVRLEPENTLDVAPITKAIISVTAAARTTASASGYNTAHAIGGAIRDALGYFKGSLKSGGDASKGSLIMSTEDSESPEFGIFETVTDAEMWY
jgi:hypothetical protein